MSEIVRRTPEETLEAAVKECAYCRPVERLVITTDENGDILTLGSTSVRSTRLGPIEMAKACILANMFREGEIAGG